VPVPQELKNRARELRSNQTDVEAKLWRRLRDRQVFGVKFRRQYPIGSYIVDFCCPTLRLIVELDGGQHAEQTRLIKPEHVSWNRAGIACCAFGIIT
jgi:very-short-patch-repair endonuclease